MVEFEIDDDDNADNNEDNFVSKFVFEIEGCNAVDDVGKEEKGCEA